MKKIFLFLLQYYSKTEKDRLQIFSVLHDQVVNTYSQQTTFGQVYNANIEFIMANPFVQSLAKEKDIKSLFILNEGLGDAFGKAVMYIQTETTKPKS